ncbi:MAG: gliding motility-associated C-terminal domain-containing protein [Bacteroidetes bacterium]|nr:gliding motility-associated C-terminal domain-containing protein [Bacteroidota bacterium]
MFIPNIFTPNNDNINDAFVIRNLPRGSLLTITNRWGIVVYESKDYKNDWKGMGLPDGVYYYLISGGQKASGWVELFSGN